MFTINQITEAHFKVKSGADFPQYVQDLIKLGVDSYETYVSDGHTSYFGKNDFKIHSDAKYSDLSISGHSDKIQFQQDLKDHQQGKTNYHTFCLDCAKSGIEKWVVSMSAMTCTYYDKVGTTILTEIIPAA